MEPELMPFLQLIPFYIRSGNAWACPSSPYPKHMTQTQPVYTSLIYWTLPWGQQQLQLYTVKEFLSPFFCVHWCTCMVGHAWKKVCTKWDKIGGSCWLTSLVLETATVCVLSNLANDTQMLHTYMYRRPPNLIEIFCVLIKQWTRARERLEFTKSNS